MHKTKIAWTEKTWNPITGCTKVSSGCTNCYAENMAHRLQGMGIKKYTNGFRVTLHENALQEPLHCSQASMIFVCSMGDIFHVDVPDSFIDRIMEVIKVTPLHTYQILTKRPERMAKYFAEKQPPQNAWVGVTVESSQEKYRLDYLRNINATVRFISAEPLLGDLGVLDLKNINWVLVAGESGSCGRPMKPEWVMSIYEQCLDKKVAFFFKQWGMWGADGVRRSKKENGNLLNGAVVHQMPYQF
jgi:protein gp37